MDRHSRSSSTASQKDFKDLPKVVLMVFARMIFAFLAQGIIALLFFRNVSHPLQAAAPWWPVYGTLIDVGCFLLLRHWSAETLADLIQFNRKLLFKDFFSGLKMILWVFPLAMGGIVSFSLIFFNSPQPPEIYQPLPFWAAIYSLTVFPLIWALMEQTTYQGYALNQLTALFQHKGLSVALVTFGWGIQHIALPFIADWRYLLYRFLSFLPLAALMCIVYMRKKRLVPFITAHWLLDAAGVFSGMILPTILQ